MEKRMASVQVLQARRGGGANRGPNHHKVSACINRGSWEVLCSLQESERKRIMKDERSGSAGAHYRVEKLRNAGQGSSCVQQSSRSPNINVEPSSEKNKPTKTMGEKGDRA